MLSPLITAASDSEIKSSWFNSLLDSYKASPNIGVVEPTNQTDQPIVAANSENRYACGARA